MLLLLISFLAGILTILAPCVLPLLPVIVGGSVSSKAKDKTRPYIIATALAGSIIFFTLILKVSTLLINLSPDVLNYISGGILIGLGVVAVFPELWERLVIRFNWQATSQRFLGKSWQTKGRYAGPILTGVALGPIFASCSPTYAFILASVLPHSLGSGLLYLVAYSIGLVLGLLLVSIVGRKLISRFSWAVDTHSLFRRAIGVLFVLIGIAIITGSEIKIETWAANHIPFDETRVERVLLSGQTKSNRISTSGILNTQATPAPEFVGLTNWINSPPLTMDQLKGKVVLVDFWTYSCINCIRTLPYIEKWNATYKDKGLVIIGVNTPEFAFEHNPANVAAAVKKDGITYPVALDNDMDTWNAYQNSSWPADYLIDKSGNIRYVSLGEGDYDKTEKAIQALLGINQPLQTPKSVVPISQTQTPETYFGGDRRSGFSGSVAPNANSNGSYAYNPTPIDQLQADSWTLGGDWLTSPQFITSSTNSTLSFSFNAKDVYMVASGPSNQTQLVTVSLSGDQAGQYGSDAPGGKVVVNASKLYHIVSLKQAGQSTVTLSVPSGISLYTFTFGS